MRDSPPLSRNRRISGNVDFMEIVKKEGLLAFSLMRLMKIMDPTLLEDSYSAVLGKFLSLESWLFIKSLFSDPGPKYHSHLSPSTYAGLSGVFIMGSREDRK